MGLTSIIAEIGTEVKFVVVNPGIEFNPLAEGRPIATLVDVQL
jgi:hypothetical protein